MSHQSLLVFMPGAACFLAFSWGTLRHFRSVGPMPSGMRLIGTISVFAMAVFTWLVFSAPVSEVWSVASLLSIGSLALFIWTVRTTRGAGFALAFADAQSPHLLTSGPFHYVRHPFYTSYLIFWLATYIATLSTLSLVGLIILLVCYTVAARSEERLMSTGQLATTYASYTLRVGMFLPRWT